ncbi:hypothetical protein BH11VER1_BH11VER1_26810 [soil metagenome]
MLNKDVVSPIQPSASFASRHPELVWSNRQAGASVWIRAALLKPRFHTLLDAAHSFGLNHVKEEWQVLVSENTKETTRVAGEVDRMLRNIEWGFRNAEAGN